MNKNLDTTPLDDMSTEDIEALAKAGETVVEAHADEAEGTEVVTEEADTESIVDVVEDTEAASTVVAAASAPVPTRSVGRPYDTTGKTNLGKARLLYAENPNLAAKELKSLFESKLGLKASVAQTYASLVRRKPATA